MANSPLADLVQLIQAWSDSAPSLKQLLTTLLQREDQIIQMLPELDGAIEALEPSLHTLGLTFILNCKAAAVPLSQPQAVQVFIGQVRRMLLGCDPAQVQMVPTQFVNLCTKFTAAAVAAKTPLAAVSPLLAAACALQPTPEHFTPIHAEALKVCILSKCYYAAAPLLEQELLQVDRDATLVTPRDLLLFFYYAGIVQTALKKFDAAVQFFTLCVSAPTLVCNTIMLEAYKKGLLCSLILKGEPPRLPKYVAPPISRTLKSASLAPYTELTEAFASGKAENLRECLTKHAAAYTTDHNLGLAKQTIPALMRRSVRTLTETFLTLSLADIAQQTGLADARAAEVQIREMISSNEICAAIDQPRGMVRFLERAETYESAATLAAMEKALSSTMALNTKLHALHNSLCTDPAYLARVSAQERHPQWDEEAMLSK